MKKIILLFIAIISLSSFAQTKTPSVEKSIYGVQTGFLGIWFHNENRLSDKIALKSEIGLDFGIGKTMFDDEITFASVPSINLEPRLYYNFKKRLAKNKNIAKNSGNYISIKTTYNPDWFIISNKDNLAFNDQLRVIPSWGIKRTYGNHFTLETGAGAGLNFIKNYPALIYIDLHFRIGYTF